MVVVIRAVIDRSGNEDPASGHDDCAGAVGDYACHMLPCDGCRVGLTAITHPTRFLGITISRCVPCACLS